jgi:hypothetical protein
MLADHIIADADLVQALVHVAMNSFGEQHRILRGALAGSSRSGSAPAHDRGEHVEAARRRCRAPGPSRYQKGSRARATTAS